MSKTTSLDIVCLSTAHWDAPLWTNRQRLMNILSERHRVLFVEPGLFSKAYSLNLLRRRPGRLMRSWQIRQEKPNLWVYSPDILPLYRFSPDIQTMAWRIALRRIRSFCNEQGMHNPVLWLYSPDAIEAVGQLNECVVIYDCVDNYAATPYSARVAERAERLKQQEFALLQCADVVTTTSRSLYDEKSQVNPNTHFVPNVGDAEHFGKALLDSTIVPDDIARIQKPIIGFVGAVNAHKLDFELIHDAATKTPDYQYVFIGPTSGWGGSTDTSQLDLANVHLLGARDYSILPGYVKAFDVCIIPYALNEYTQHVFPLKFYEFMAAGKPIVTTALPSLLPHGETICIANSSDEFADGIACALADDNPDAREKRVELARQNTWHHRAQQIERYVFEAVISKCGDRVDWADLVPK